jgi:uncharacterized membrane protein YozB (DUF420 family)
VTLDSPGFLLETSTLGGDLNLIAQLVLGVVLLAGVELARRGRYRAHGACQTTALALTILLTFAWMLPAFREVYEPAIERGLLTRVNLAAAAHVILGMLTLLLGVWVVLVAGTNVVPPRWRFRNYKGWMRTLLTLWWVGLTFGVATYWFGGR